MAQPAPLTDPKLQSRLIEALRSGYGFPDAVMEVEILETHISCVVLAGGFAYKIKKAIDLGFLDFRSLDGRRRFCEEEVRLNRRTAPDLYLDVVPITGSPEHPRIGGPGEPVEHAVRMRRFDYRATLDKLASCGSISPAMIDAIADRLAAFHASIDVAGPDSGFGTPEAVGKPALDNLAALSALLAEPSARKAVADHADWVRRQHVTLENHFRRRLESGFVRECHGDLHLGNIAWIDGTPVFFDCIEFDPSLRWIDVANELAFLGMDLVHRGRAGLAWRLINRYLERTGDYEGLPALAYYLAYRAMVRAKVALLGAPTPQAVDASSAYLRLAADYATPRKPFLLLTHGLSGSGKTVASQAFAEYAGAIRIRSDLERKRLMGLEPTDRSMAGIGSPLYGADASRATYARLLNLARLALRSGHPVIVDAAFLASWQRRVFLDLAQELEVPCAILALAADPAQLKARVARRQAEDRDASDADLAVLEQQLRAVEPFDEHERDLSVELSLSGVFEEHAVDESWRRVEEKFRRANAQAGRRC